jgi:hypothetical protein
MKHVKILGLMAVAALAVMAFVGVSSASAKACSTTGSGAACGAGHGNELTTETLAAASTGTRQVKLTSGFITVECDSSLSGKEEHEGKGTLTSLTFTNCVSSLGACTSAKANASTTNPYKVSTTGTGEGNGTMTVTGSITGEFTCAGITCKYTAGEAGGANGSIVVAGSTDPETKNERAAKATASSIVLNKEEGSSGFCSGTAIWEGPYQVSNPATLWIT